MLVTVHPPAHAQVLPLKWEGRLSSHHAPDITELDAEEEVLLKGNPGSSAQV